MTPAVVAALVAALIGLPAGPSAAAAPPPHRAVPVPVAAPSPAPSPSPGSLADLERQAAEQGAEVERAQAALKASSKAAAAALEAYATAAREVELSRAAAVRQQEVLNRALTRLDAQRSALGRWAVRAYAEGNGLGSDPALTTLLGGSADDLVHARRWLSIAGNERGRQVQAFQQAALDADAAADSADRASAAAQNALLVSTAAKAARDAAVTTQQRTLATLQARLSRTQDAAAEAARQAALLAQARALALKGAADNRITGPVGDCAGGDTHLYPNGQIPLTALCPLWGAPGHHLRADAAFAFDRLSNAYARAFGRPICVTDSYRSYAEQVAVKAEKPHLAATPGTSNHGWGTALDLCEGIERFGTREHTWMLANAPAFGWFHPSWAAASGSKPEAWHWEFGG